MKKSIPRSIVVACAVAAAVLSTAGAAPGQAIPGQAIPGRAADGAGTLSARGISVVKRQPNTLRMQVELTVKAKTAKEAVTKLKARREAALAQLAKLEAEKDSIKSSDPKIVPAQSDRQRQMEMMVRQRMRQSGKKSKKAPEAPPVAVAATITAEWKLDAGDPDARLLAAHALEEKIRAADLAGSKEKDTEASSPEEEEEAEEEMPQMGVYEDQNQPKAGEPMFVYVAKLGKEEQEKAYAAAFVDARSRAERLATASGVELGPLRFVSANSTPLGMQNYGGSYNRYMQQMYQQMYVDRSEGGEDDVLGEAVGPQAHEVSLSISIDAQFGMSPSGSDKAVK